MQRGEPDRVLSEARDAVDRLNDEAWALRRLDRAQCREISGQALEGAERIAYQRGRGYALRNLGFCDYIASDFPAALGSLSEGLEIGEWTKDEPLQRDCLNFMGAVYSSLGDLGTAFAHTERTYQLNQRIGSPKDIAHSLVNLGVLHHQLGRNPDALRVYGEAAELGRESGDPGLEALALGNLIPVQIGLGRYAEAAETGREALALSRRLGLKDVQARAMVNLGEALGRSGRSAEGLEVLGEALELVKAEGMSEGEVYCHLNQALLLTDLGEPQGAVGALELALGKAERLGTKDLQLQAHQRLAQAHKALGDFENALLHHERFHEMERAVRTEQAEQRLRALGVQRELDKTRAEAELERVKNVELSRALEALSQANREKSALVLELQAKSEELALQAVQDPLTKLHNRRYLEQTLAAEYAQAQASGQPIAVAMMDVDNFKQVNDRFSHQVGDQVLRAVAEILRRAVRGADFAARYGGEEFVLALPQTPLERAAQLCERLRASVEAHPWAEIHPELKVTISLGLAAGTAHPNHEKLLDAADHRLYEAKRGGKNRVVAG